MVKRNLRGVSLAQAPVGGALAETVFQELLVLAHGVEGGTRGVGVAVLQTVGHGVADGFVDHVDIGLRFLDGQLGPDRRRGAQVDFGLAQEQRHLLQPRDDVPDAVGLGCVFQHQGVKRRLSQSFRIDHGIMRGALDFAQIENLKRALIPQQNHIGAVLGGEFGGVQLVQAAAKFLIIAKLPVQVGGRHVVQHLVQILLSIDMQPGSGGGGRRKGKSRMTNSSESRVSSSEGVFGHSLRREAEKEPAQRVSP